IVSPPPLIVISPADGIETGAAALTVSGKTEREVLVRINGERVGLRGDGTFTAEVNLQQGVNVIKISAQKPHSGERVLFRRVLLDHATAASAVGTELVKH